MNKQLFGKGSIYLLIALLAGIFLLFLSGGISMGEKASVSGSPEDFELCEQRCEERLSSILSEVNGIREVSVMVTLDELPSSKERPRIRGVAVVCKGEETSELRLKIVMLTSSALGVTSDKIFVTFS